MSKLKNKQAGSFLVAAIIMILFLTSIGLSIASLVALQYQHTRRQIYVQNAELVAEAGVEQSVHQLNNDDSFAGFTSAQQLFSNSTQGRGTYTTTIATNADGESKTIISTGNVYRHVADTSPYLTRQIKVVVVGTTASGYSVATGAGGLILGGNAAIANSSVYVNGLLDMSGTSTIGTQQNPVTVDVSNIACPLGSNPGPTYPSLCSGSEPISMTNNVQIWGSVCATGQTSTGPNNNIQGGNGGAGLEIGCISPHVPQPIYDRQDIIDAVTTTGSGSSGTYACSGSNKNVIWPANLKLTGDVSIGLGCKTLTINGNVYITGTLTVNSSPKIIVADSLGTTRPIIIVDGTIDVGGSASMIANTSGTGADFVSFKNNTGNPAATPTGNNLYSSQQMQNVKVNGSASTAGMIFDAYWSEVVLVGSGNIGAAAGQTVNMAGAGTVVFGTTLSSGSKTWSISSYQPLY